MPSRRARAITASSPASTAEQASSQSVAESPVTPLEKVDLNKAGLAEGVVAVRRTSLTVSLPAILSNFRADAT
jgi:hypothetical protein